MGVSYVVIALAFLVVSTCSVFYNGYDTGRLSRNDEGPCCNGTLGVASNMTRMPCSAMRCCNNSETVAVLPVNYALGYSFRCLPKDIFTKCYADGKNVFSTNETSVKYIPKRCCDKHRFHILINQNYTALTIKCMPR